MISLESMASDISTIIDSFSLTDEETQCVGLPKTVVERGIDSCKFSVFMIVYGRGFIHAPGFCIAMAKPWKCAANSFKLYVLKDNVFHLIFTTAEIQDRVLFEGLWNFDNKLLIIKPWDPVSQEPLQIFDSTYFSYRVSGLPSWCYMPEIGRLLAFVLEDNVQLEICTSKRNSIVVDLKTSLSMYLVQILGLGKVEAKIQYERLPTFCYFYGWIGHIFTHCDVLKNTLGHVMISHPYLESLGVSDKSEFDYSRHEKLSLSNDVGFISSIRALSSLIMWVLIVNIL